MLDFGWAELLVVIAVAVFVVGPQDIPKIMYSLGRILRRVQYIRYAVSQQFDDLMNAGDIEELRKGVNFETARKESNIVTEKQQDEDIPQFLNVEEIYAEICDQYDQTFNKPSNYIDDFLKKLPLKASILDVGCGVGVDVKHMKTKGFSVEGIDLSKQMLSKAKEKNPDIHFIHGNIKDHNFSDKKYDAIVSAYSMIHFKKDEALFILSKIFDLLKDNGLFFISVHSGQSEERIMPEPFNPSVSFFLNIFSIDELKHLLQAAGFSILDIFERGAEEVAEMDYNKTTIFAQKLV